MTQEDLVKRYWYNRMMNVTARGYANQSIRQIAAGCGTVMEGKQLRPYLRELWLDGYDPQYDGLEVVVDDPSSYSMFGACSSVRLKSADGKASFHGRNFDFTYDNHQTYIIHVKDTEKNCAFNCVVKDMFKPGTSLRKLPNMAVDGINQFGVCVNINVVSKKDLDEMGPGFENKHGTNPGATKVHMLVVPSVILAHAESAVDALKLMHDSDIYGDLVGLEHVHFMISDKDDTFIVEVIGDKLKVWGWNRNEHNDCGYVTEEEDKNPPIMTNWYLCNDSFPSGKLVRVKYTANGCGIERYDTLYSLYGRGGYETSEQETADMMKAVRFTNEVSMSPATNEHYPFSDLGFGAKWEQHHYLDNVDGFGDLVDAEILKIKTALLT